MPTFILRKLDPDFWAQVRAKAAAEGVPLRALILRLLAAWLAAGLVLSVTACSGPGALAPSAVPLRPIALAGQSNALFVLPFVVRAVAPAAVVGYAQDGSTIAEWGAGTANWTQLAVSLHQPLRAFVWWQGESDRDSTTYPADLVAFMARVRTEAADPGLRILVCRVVDDPAFVTLRLEQAAYVAADARSVLVSSDGLEREHPEWLSGSAHLSAAGYTAMADRIRVALP